MIGQVIKKAQVRVQRLRWLAPAAIESRNRRSDPCTPRGLMVRHGFLERVHRLWSVDFQIDLVQMPSPMRLQATLPQICSDHRPEMIHPAPNRFVG